MASRLGEGIDKRINEAKPNSATYSVHGVITKVYADDHLLALAVQDFLRSFRGQPGSAADIEFYLLTREPGFELETGGQKGNSELLYDWNVLRYSREGRIRYQEVPGAGSIVADPDAGLAVAFVDSDMAACSWSIAHVIFFPMWAQLLKTRGVFPIHAAGLQRNGKGILFPGRSGCGKSTMSLHLLRNGYKLLGDDTVFVRKSEKGAEMLFFPEEVDVCSETVDLFPRLALARNMTEDRWQPKARVNLNEVGPDAVVESSDTHLIVFPVISADGETRYERIGPTEALAELILYAFLFMDPQTSKENFALLASLVQTTSCFRLHMGLDGSELAGAVDGIIATVS
ncbi:MAG: hypothetical protein M1455_10780 [Actinobacteria bacterium]|nr:hypothetical protein [Actinomycetota bacterium]